MSADAAMRTWKSALAVAWVGVFVLGVACTDRAAILTCLPPTVLDGKWKLADSPTVVRESNQDSAHGTYRSAGEAIDVTVYDMGTEDHARAMVQLDAGATDTARLYYDGNIGACVGVVISGRYVFSVVSATTPGDEVAAFMVAIAHTCR